MSISADLRYKLGPWISRLQCMCWQSEGKQTKIEQPFHSSIVLIYGPSAKEETRSHYVGVDVDILELTVWPGWPLIHKILLPLPFECWDLTHAPPCLPFNEVFEKSILKKKKANIFLFLTICRNTEDWAENHLPQCTENVFIKVCVDALILNSVVFVDDTLVNTLRLKQAMIMKQPGWDGTLVKA